MLKFVNTRTVPPGGLYFYTVPETGASFRHATLPVLIARVQSHYRENGLDLPDELESRIEDHMCLQLPAGFCRGDAAGRPRKKTVTLASIRKATAALAAGNPRVLPGEAERRARVCSRCPLNDQTACTSCTGLTAWARKLAGASLYGLDSAIGICQVDCAALSAKVHLSDIPDSEEYPETCWRSK